MKKIFLFLLTYLSLSSTNGLAQSSVSELDRILNSLEDGSLSSFKLLNDYADDSMVNNQIGLAMRVPLVDGETQRFNYIIGNINTFVKAKGLLNVYTVGEDIMSGRREKILLVIDLRPENKAFINFLMGLKKANKDKMYTQFGLVSLSCTANAVFSDEANFTRVNMRVRNQYCRAIGMITLNSTIGPARI